MKTSVLVTGVAGTGKSTVCEALQKIGCHARDIESIEGLYELFDEKAGRVQGNMDQIRDGLYWYCNKGKLQQIVDSETAEQTLYCGGMANTEDVWDVFDNVIVLTVSDETTVRRLSTRAPGEFGSTQENRDWILRWKHDLEQRWLRMGGIAVDAEGNPEEIAELVIKNLSRKDKVSKYS
jgi:dephospho-CoA kinase